MSVKRKNAVPSSGKQPKISVIVPIYKVEKYLMQCVDSILNQTLKEIEVILIDEGDTDACYAIMLYYADTDNRVKIIHERCGGYGAACNKGIKAARGEYVSIIESDDFIEPTMYEELYAKAKELDVDVIKGPYFEYYDTHAKSSPYRELCGYAKHISEISPKIAFSIFEFPQQMAVHASVWSGIYRTSFLKDNGIYFIDKKPGAYVDVEFRLRTFAEARSIAWNEKPFYNWRLSNLASSTNTFNLSTMLQRWSEAHDYYDKSPRETYETLGPYHILDEYLNTWSQLKLEWIKKSEADFQWAKKNLSRIPRAVFIKSPVLSLRQKREILAAQKAGSLTEFLQLTEKKGRLSDLAFRLFNN